jgi:hypothetical protein
LQDSLDFPEFQIVFVRERLWTKSTSHGPQAPSVHHGPTPWPTSGAHWSSASGHSGAQGHWGRAGEVEEAAASTFVGSLELGRWGHGGVVERDGRRWSVLDEVGVADSGVSKGGRG